MSKFHNEKMVVGDQIFDSRHEYARWRELQLMQRAGEIADLKRQVKYELLPVFRDENGKILERAVNYVADFVYTDLRDGCTQVEDAKGMRTKEYIIKRKMMLHKYGIRIMEV